MNMTKGFVTVATGKYYCRLAQNLAMSYRLYSKTEYPMYVLTDKDGEKRLKKYFDGVIVMDKPTYTFLDKISVYRHSPFEETIFLDADMNIIRDISFLFDEFEKNGSEVSCVGSVRSIAEWGQPIHFGVPAVEKYRLTEYIAFGGGIYYYKKCEKTDAFMSFIFQELIPNYHNLQMKVFRPNQLADEPLMGLAMLVYGMKPLDTDIDIMKYDDNMMETLKWNMNQQKCTFIWKEGKRVYPAIVHYGTHNTRHKKYVYYNSILRCNYKKIRPLTPFYLIYSETGLLFLHISRKNDRKAFYSWFFSHFTKRHMQYRKQQIKALFKKNN